MCPFLRPVQGSHHLGASIHHFHGTKAQPCSHLHLPQLLVGSRSCLAPIYGVCWDSSLIPPTLGALAWSVIASCGHHDVFTLSPVKRGQQVSLYLLGMDPLGQPEGAPWLGAPTEDVERWHLRRASHCLHSLLSAWMEPLWSPFGVGGVDPALLSGKARPVTPSVFQRAGS